MWQTKVVAYSTPISPHPSQLTAPDLTRYAQCLEEVHPSPSPSSLSGSHDWSKLGCASISLASYSLSLRHVLNIWPKSRVGSLLRAFWERFSSHLKKQKKRHCKKTFPHLLLHTVTSVWHSQNCGTVKGVNRRESKKGKWRYLLLDSIFEPLN